MFSHFFHFLGSSAGCFCLKKKHQVTLEGDLCLTNISRDHSAEAEQISSHVLTPKLHGHLKGRVPAGAAEQTRSNDPKKTQEMWRFCFCKEENCKKIKPDCFVQGSRPMFEKQPPTVDYINLSSFLRNKTKLPKKSRKNKNSK